MITIAAVTLAWRDDGYSGRNLLYAGRIYIGLVVPPDSENDGWRYGLFDAPGGKIIGMCAIEADARSALERAAVKALGEKNA
jgi:hypothetical protein